MSVASTIEYARTVPLITEGLDEPYSPNHSSGMSTSKHIFTQLDMLQLLERRDYSNLTKMVDNPKVPETLRVTQDLLESLLDPLREGLTPSDWRVLAAVCAFHDVGKVRLDWAGNSNLCLEGVEWIAHDFDSEQILQHNPGLLAPLKLTDSEHGKVTLLSRLHSLPGQFFFGEGNLSGYRPVAQIAISEDSENFFKVARIQGMLDVMSALNHGMVNPILKSHQKLGQCLSRAFLDRVDLAEVERDEDKSGIDGEFREVQQEFSLGEVSLGRLRRLTGQSLPAHHYRKGLSQLHDDVVQQFHQATDNARTWYGTYVANALGVGLIKVLGEENASLAIATLVRVVASVSRCSITERDEWAFSALQPALAILDNPKAAEHLLNTSDSLKDPESGATALKSGNAPLRVRVGQSGVSLEMTKPPS